MGLRPLAPSVGAAIAAIVLALPTSVRSETDLSDTVQLTLQVQPTAETSEISEGDRIAVQQAIADRASELGIVDASVQVLECNQLLVELPGVHDLDFVQQVLGETAQLEFRAQSPDTEQPFRIEHLALRNLELEQWARQQATDAELPVSADSDAGDGSAESSETPLDQALRERHQAIEALFAPAELTGAQVVEAHARPSERRRFIEHTSAQSQGDNILWEIMVEFDAEGAQQFAELTRDVAGTGRRVGIFLDDRLVSAPTVSVDYADTGITGGMAVISGEFNAESAEALVAQLRAGALPLPVEIIDIRAIPASH